MHKEVFLLVLILAAMFAAYGCSSDNGASILPDEPRAIELSASSHYNWGMWQFKANPGAQTLEVVPLRYVDMHLNALKFLEPPPKVYLTVESLAFNGNIIEADIGLRHPFLGLAKFTGFDVCGILISNGSVSGFADPDLVMTGEGDTRLLNPDGFARWWNPAEFPVNEGTMFSYNDGLLGAPDSVADYNATLNGYKYYTDSLEPNGDLSLLDPAERGVFSPGVKNVRHFSIEIGGEGLIFNYAIDANWAFPQGGPPWEVDDFPEKANRPEAWNIVTTETTNTLWNDGSSSGGNLSLSIDVYDHYNPDMNEVTVESPGNFDAVSSPTAVGGGTGFSTYEIDITGATPAEDEIELLISVECEAAGYGGLLPGKTVTAYFMTTASVSDTSPITGVYVDGDNAADPLEDGSMSHPFDTIQEGIDAAGIGDFTDIWDIYVDPYEGGDYALFTFKNDAQLIGYAFNAGSGKPELVLTGQWTVANGLDNIRLENFLITFDHTTQSGGGGTLFSGSNTTNFTIEDCKFTGRMSYQSSTFLSFSFCDNLTLEHNEFDAIRNKSTYSSNYHQLMLILWTSCDDVLIRHNEIHDIGYDDEGASTTTNNTHTDIFSMRCTGSSPPDYCTDVHFHNNLIYDITNYSDTDTVAVNYTKILGWNAQID